MVPAICGPKETSGDVRGSHLDVRFAVDLVEKRLNRKVDGGTRFLARNPHGTSNRPQLEANLLIHRALRIVSSDRSDEVAVMEIGGG